MVIDGQFPVITAVFVVGDPSLVEVAFFFFNDTGTTEIYALSQHDALPIAPELSETPLAPPQLSTGGTAALMAQPFQPADALSKLQVPVLVGRVSDSFTPDATPGPLLCTVIV